MARNVDGRRTPGNSRFHQWHPPATPADGLASRWGPQAQRRRAASPVAPRPASSSAKLEGSGTGFSKMLSTTNVEGL